MSSLRIPVHVAGRSAVVMKDHNSGKWGVAYCGVRHVSPFAEIPDITESPTEWLCTDGESWQAANDEGAPISYDPAVGEDEVMLCELPTSVLERLALLR